jgi:hypothetical protein
MNERPEHLELKRLENEIGVKVASHFFVVKWS